MSIIPKLLLILFMLASSYATSTLSPDWGFFGHRKINKMAVFTLPQEMIGFYKKHIAYIERHSIAPDKRRYSLPIEGVRHYIDLDYFDYKDVSEFPRSLDKAIAFNSKFYLVDEEKDSSLLMKTSDFALIDSGTIANERLSINVLEFLAWNSSLSPYGRQREEYSHSFDIEKLPSWVSLKTKRKGIELVVVDKFSEYGIAPYFIQYMFKDLVFAFENLDGKKILRLSSELGHYLSDVHVPLHTTKNYNGELTDQVGIHAFWETRLPELYADSKYDFMVGKAEYVADTKEYIWNTISQSHELVSDVLDIEKQLSNKFPDDQQYCYEERNSRTIRIECEEYAQAYHEEMGGMVEERMQSSILAVGSFWFSAWVAAGQPDLSGITEDLDLYAEANKAKDSENKVGESSTIKARQHNN